VITGAKSHPNTANNAFFQAVNSLKPTHNSLTKISGIYPHTREQTIAELSKNKEDGPVDIDKSTIQAYIHFASDEYDKAFREDNSYNQAWWDGALAMARWIQEADGQ